MDAVIDELEAGIGTQEKDGVLPPGLLEQFRHQISVFKNDNLADLQLIAFPGFFPIKCNKPALPLMLYTINNCMQQT